ncbi:synaptotagmin-like protein 2 isoform X1 [Chiloscyllium plagiosum]|uniref:synaptotagmin-like protein 2 isoform X1 n=1 Tax=Chiloscyllium plagiosum TaxID=36176 RepID=UPI001CB7D72F|nr:synaptotagmin-like protein 2 isoform X1 [Chiloscyllium plagiosum]
MEQRHEAPSAQSQMPDKYTAEHMKAADESISKVLDWFTRSEEMPSVNERLKEVEPPSEPIVENKLPLNAKPDTEFSHTESDIFTKSLQEMQNVNGEIQRSGEQGIQLKEVQTPTKVNIFHKSVIPEAIVLEEKSKMKTKNGFESTYPISENVIKSSNNQQQHIRLERDESKQGLLVSEKGRVEANVSADGESDSQATSNVNFFLATTNKNDIQVTESRSESTSLNPEESKTLPTSGVSDITEDALNAFQNLSSKHRTSYQENSFANAVFRKSAENEDTIDIKSSNYKSANKASNAVTTASLNSTFFDNGAEKELDRTKIKKQQSVDGNEHVTTTRENPFLEQARQGSNEHIDVPVYDGQSALRKNTTLNKAKTKSSLKQNEEETNVLQDKIHVKAIDLKQTLNNDENSTKVNFQLEKNDTNVIPKNEKPFTIVSIKKKICNTSDDPHQDLSHFTNLRNFWDKGTKTLDDDELGLANTSDDKHSILKIATNTEQKMLLEAKPSITNYPDDLSKNESMKTEECHGPSVQERMQQILQQRESQPDKKRLNTKYFPKVLPTEPEEIKLKLKTANNALNKNELLSTSNDFQKHSSEVGESAQERIICDPKSQESNNLNVGLQWRHQEKDENETSLIEEQHKHERVLLSDNQTFMLSDESADRMINSQSLLEDINQSRPNTYSKIGNNKDDNISEKLLQSQIPNVLKPPEKSFQNENSSIKQISSKEVSSNEENLALFAGRSPLVEENDIPQKNLNNSESLDNMIHGNLKTVEEDKLSSIKNDKGSKYNENLGIDLNKDNRGFDLQDQFQMELNLPSGTTRTSTFKENSDSPTKRSMESFKAGAQDNPDQDASSKNVLLDYSRGSDHLHAETWRSSLSEEEEGSSLALKRNSRTSETYKSLQDIHVISSRMPNTLDSTNQEMLLSADNVSSIPTTPENTSLQSKRMKRLSKSVPAFPENDDADSMSEGSFQMDKHGTIASSLTNISGSSGMASRSSVSGSTMSIYSSDIGNIDVRGKIQFSLDYVDKLKEFHIFVVRCSDLAAAEEKKNRSDPYVKSYLLPDKIKTGKRKTTVKKRTLNPVYNEILRYKIDKASLMAQTLNLSVWHNDTFGRNSFLGEVEVELRKWDWSNKKMDWHDLKPRTISANRTGDKGSLKVAFRYIPQGYKGKKTGEVQIWVKEASNLPQIRPSRLDPFVKCFILPDTSRKSRQKTRVVKKSTNPVFNHTMVYDGFSTEDLKDACVELSVWDHDKLINHFLGGLRIGLGTGKSYGLTVDWMDSTEEEISVWDKMMTHPNTWVEDVLPLRMLMLSKMSGT